MNEKGNGLNVLEVIKADELRKLEDMPDMVIFPADNEFRFFPDGAYSGEPPIFEFDGEDRWVKFIGAPFIEFIEPSKSWFMDCNRFISSGGIVAFLLDPENHASFRDAMMFASNMYCLHLYNIKGQFAVDDLKGEYLMKMSSRQLLENLELPLMVGYSSCEGVNLKYRKDGRFIRYTACWGVSAKPIVEELAAIALEGSRKKFIKTERDCQALSACYWEFLAKIKKSCDKNSPGKNYKSIICKARQFWRKISRGDIDAKIPFLQYRNPPLTIASIHDCYYDSNSMNSIVPLPTRLMRNGSTASNSLENNPDILAIDKDKCGWPIAVARKFGHGSVVFLPSCIDIENFKSKLSAIKVAATGARGWDLLEKLVKTPVADTVKHIVSIQGKDIKKTPVVVLKYVPNCELELSDNEAFTISLDGAPDLNVMTKHFIGLMVLRYASEVGSGIIFTRDRRAGSNRIMMLDKDGKPAKLPAVEIFKGTKKIKSGTPIDAEPSARLKRTVCYAIFNHEDDMSDEKDKFPVNPPAQPGDSQLKIPNAETNEQIYKMVMRDVYDSGRKERKFKLNGSAFNYMFRKLNLEISVQANVVEELKFLKISKSIPCAKAITETIIPFILS